jgi:hypothetical protein
MASKPKKAPKQQQPSPTGQQPDFSQRIADTIQAIQPFAQGGLQEIPGTGQQFYILPGGSFHTKVQNSLMNLSGLLQEGQAQIPFQGAQVPPGGQLTLTGGGITGGKQTTTAPPASQKRGGTQLRGTKEVTRTPAQAATAQNPNERERLALTAAGFNFPEPPLLSREERRVQALIDAGLMVDAKVRGQQAIDRAQALTARLGVKNELFKILGEVAKNADEQQRMSDDIIAGHAKTAADIMGNNLNMFATPDQAIAFQEKTFAQLMESGPFGVPGASAVLLEAGSTAAGEFDTGGLGVSAGIQGGVRQPTQISGVAAKDPTRFTAGDEFRFDFFRDDANVSDSIQKFNQVMANIAGSLESIEIEGGRAPTFGQVRELTDLAMNFAVTSGGGEQAIDARTKISNRFFEIFEELGVQEDESRGLIGILIDTAKKIVFGDSAVDSTGPDAVPQATGDESLASQEQIVEAVTLVQNIRQRDPSSQISVDTAQLPQMSREDLEGVLEQLRAVATGGQ